MRGGVRTRWFAAFVAVLSVGAGLVVTGVAPASAAPATERAGSARVQEWGAVEEQAFVEKINQLRTSLGLAVLAVDVELTTQSRIWAQTMKDSGGIFHTTNLSGGITSDWEKLGENVGVGGTVDALFDAFVASPKHYENLVDPSYRWVGVGVVWDGARMFTTHRFMALMPPPEATTAPAPTARPVVEPAPTEAPTSPPPELAATEPVPDPAAPSAASPTPAPASPERVALILRTVDDLFA